MCARRKIAGQPNQLIRLDKCYTDPQVQRGQEVKHQTNIDKTFDDDGVGTIVVSKRGDMFSVLDGQQRTDVLRERGYTHVYAVVFTRLSIEREAELFGLFNNTKPIKPADLFRIAMLQPNSEELKIVGLLTRHNLQLKLRTGDEHENLIGAVKTIWNIQKKYTLAGLDQILTVLMTGFANGGQLQTRAKTDRFLNGLAKAVNELCGNAGLRPDRVGRMLKGLEAEVILSEARTVAKGNGRKEIDSVADWIVNYVVSAKTAKLAA